MSDSTESSAPWRKVARTVTALRSRHQQRHQPTGYGFVFADRIQYLDSRVWDQMARLGTLFLRRAVLEVVERHGPENLTPRYAIIFKEDKPVAIVAAQIVTVSGRQVANHSSSEGEQKKSRLLRKVLAPAIHAARANLRERILVAGNLLSWGFHGIAFAPDEDCTALWTAVAEALYRMRRADRLIGQTDLILVKDLTEQEKGLDALQRFSYRPLRTEPNMVLSIDPAWNTYEDYLGALGAKYRRNAKDQVKKLQAAGCTVEPLTDLVPHTQRLHELYLSVQGNASVRLVTLPETYLPALAAAAGDDFRCTVIRRREQLLGFVTSLRDGGTAVAYYIGFDRAAAAEGLPIYLRLLHATIADAVAWKCQRLSLGRTALEPKAALGAKPEGLTIWLRHRVPVVNWLMRGLLGAVPHSEAPERNAFREGAA